MWLPLWQTPDHPAERPEVLKGVLLSFDKDLIGKALNSVYVEAFHDMQALEESKLTNQASLYISNQRHRTEGFEDKYDNIIIQKPARNI